MSAATLQQEQTGLSALPKDVRRRVLMTAGCADCREIPKVPLAGQTFAGPAGRFQLMHNGVRILEDCYCGRWMTELIRRLEGHHEPQEEKAFHELLAYVPAGGTMVELGSWWAYYSLWFRARVPEARLFLVEPDPRNLEVGRQNFALNGADGRFFNYSVGRASQPAAPFRCDDGLVYPVPQISVDDLLTQTGIGRVDLLLVDIQGAELEMLAGAVRSLARGAIRFLVLSTHHHSISGDPLIHQKCLHFLQEHQAHVLAEHNIAESYSGDGLIVASLDPADRNLAPIEISHNRASNGLFRELEYDLADAWETLRRGRRQGRLRDAMSAWTRQLRPWWRRLGR
jgi:FkbM family methyltransferase